MVDLLERRSMIVEKTRPVQIIKNGDFSQGLLYYEPNTGTNIEIVDGYLKITKVENVTYGGIAIQRQKVYTTHKYYQKCTMGEGSSSDPPIYYGFSGPSATVSGNIQIPASTVILKAYDQITSPYQGDAIQTWRIGSSAYPVGIVGRVKYSFMIDLTATFGAGNEPSLEECRHMFPNDYYEYYNPEE